MEKLKPCPFCGCKAVAIVDKTMNYHGVTCMNCTARVYGYSTRDLAVAAWNKRKTHDEVNVNQYGENCISITNAGTLDITM